MGTLYVGYLACELLLVPLMRCMVSLQNHPWITLSNTLLVVFVAPILLTLPILFYRFCNEPDDETDDETHDETYNETYNETSDETTEAASPKRPKRSPRRPKRS